MTKRDDATAALGADVGQWAACQRITGRTWQQVAQRLYEETHVSVQAKTVKRWALEAVED